MASSTIKKDLKTKKIQLGTATIINGNFQINFIDNTISIIGVVGFSINNRDDMDNIHISAVTVSSINMITIYGKADSSVTVPNSAYVIALYE